MRPIFYEIKRTLTSRFVIILIIAIVGLSSLLAYENASSLNSSNVPSNPNVAYGYFISNNNLTMVGYVYNGYGEPFKDVRVYYQYNGTEYSSVSSSSGFANVTIPIKSSSYISMQVNYTYKQFGRTLSSPVVQYIIYGLKNSGLEVYPGIYNPRNSSNLGFIVMYIGENGSLAPPVKISVLGTNSTNFSNILYNYSLNVSSFSVIKIFPPMESAYKNYTFFVKAENIDGSQIKIYSGLEGGKLYSMVPIYRLSTYVPYTQDSIQKLVFSGITSILDLFMPLLAIFTSYLTYGKDRTSGVLESVLKRPVTKGELITTRFVSNVIAILIASTVAMLSVDLIYHYYFSIYFGTTFFIDLVWTYFVEGVAFLSLIYLISHIIKSQGSLLGFAIGIFIVMDLFWQVIPYSIISALGISPSSSSYVTINMMFDYLSPAGYSNLFQALLTGKLGYFGGIIINPDFYGINYFTLFTSGLLWIIVPFIIAYFLAKIRD
jgi:ABC-2 type transport system permease protein